MRVSFGPPYLVVSGGPVAIPVRLHWSLTIGLAVFGGFTLGGALGFFLLILVHELGHALLVRSRGLRTISIDMHWMGGECRYSSSGSALDHAVIAWGGVLAQSLLLAVTVAFLAWFNPSNDFVADLASTLIIANLCLIVANLLPLPSLDGAKAWSVFPLLLAKRRRRALELRRDSIRRELDEIEQDDDDDSSKLLQ